MSAPKIRWAIDDAIVEAVVFAPTDDWNSARFEVLGRYDLNQYKDLSC